MGLERLVRAVELVAQRSEPRADGVELVIVIGAHTVVDTACDRVPVLVGAPQALAHLVELRLQLAKCGE